LVAGAAGLLRRGLRGHGRGLRRRVRVPAPGRRGEAPLLRARLAVAPAAARGGLRRAGAERLHVAVQRRQAALPPAAGGLRLLPGEQATACTGLSAWVAVFAPRAYWMRRLSEAKLARRLRSGAHVLVKTHEWRGEYGGLLPRWGALVLVSARDPRGALASHRRMGWAQELPAEHAAHHAAWQRHAAATVAFGDIAGGAAGAALAAVAAALGLRPGPEQLLAVQLELAQLSAPASRTNVTTKMWPRHLSAGAAAARAGLTWRLLRNVSRGARDT
ncbi:unnamed protein product, partial [Prorocentrum cordatum]